MNKRADAAVPMGIEKEKQDNIKKEKSKRSVYIYIATLFLIVLLFILLSYFIQQRNNSELNTLNEKNLTAQQNIENLQTSNIQLQSDNDAYKAKVAELEAQISELSEQIDGIKDQWRKDVQKVRLDDTSKYNELLAKYNELLENNKAKGK